MGEFICRIFAWPLVKAYELTGSYGLAVIFFALLVNIILTPFMAKSKQSMMRSTRLQPKIQELQRRHEGNQQKLQAEMQKLYQEEGINPMSGCLWSLIPFPILIALYSVIRRPITRMMFAADSVVDTLKEFMITQGWYTEVTGRADAYAEIKLANLAHQHWDEVNSALAGKIDGLMNVDYSFLGLNMGDQPQWNFFMDTNWSDPKIWAPAFGLFLIPFISAALSWLAMKVGQATNPSTDTQAAASMKTMNFMMPLMSIWICFIMPAAMGIYWIANSVFGIIRDYILTKVYKKKLDEEDAVRAAQRAEREKEMEAKKAEYERLKAEGKTPINANTSKKKLQASEWTSARPPSSAPTAPPDVSAWASRSTRSPPRRSATAATPEAAPTCPTALTIPRPPRPRRSPPRRSPNSRPPSTRASSTRRSSRPPSRRPPSTRSGPP